MSENGWHRQASLAVSWVIMDLQKPQALHRAHRARPALRRRLLRRRDVHRHLLPADLPGEDAQGGELPLLRHAAGGRAGGLPSVPALPARARAGQRAGRRCAADRAAIVQRLEEGTLDDEAELEAIAEQFELSSRQIRRIVQKELGVPPIQLVLTRRCCSPSSCSPRRRCRSPRWRSRAASRACAVSTTRSAAATACRPRACASRDGRRTARPRARDFTLLLSYRAPYDWHGRARVPRARALAGVEEVTDDAYVRTVRLGARRGGFASRSAEAARAARGARHSLTPALPALLARVRALFDLDARPDVIARASPQGPRLDAAVGEPRPARPRRVRRIRARRARDPRPAGHGKGRDDHRGPLRRGVRRADRDAARGAQAPVTRRRRASPRPASTRSPASASSARAAGA